MLITYGDTKQRIHWNILVHFKAFLSKGGSLVIAAVVTIVACMSLFYISSFQSLPLSFFFFPPLFFILIPGFNRCRCHCSDMGHGHAFIKRCQLDFNVSGMSSPRVLLLSSVPPPTSFSLSLFSFLPLISFCYLPLI